METFNPRDDVLLSFQVIKACRQQDINARTHWHDDVSAGQMPVLCSPVLAKSSQSHWRDCKPPSFSSPMGFQSSFVKLTPLLLLQIW